MEAKHLLLMSFTYMALTKSFFSESIVYLLEYREGTYGEHFWTINQILVNQSDFCNRNT